MSIQLPKIHPSWRALLISVLLLTQSLPQRSADAAQPAQRPAPKVFLPAVSLVFPEPTAGQCADGTHLTSADGFIDSADPDSEPSTLSGAVCRPNRSPDQLFCGVHGTAVAVGQTAACSCTDGYAGGQCNTCAAGYARDDAGSCALIPVAAGLIISGADRSVPFGGSVLLSVEISRTGAARETAAITGTWRVKNRVGCVQSVAAGGGCGAEASGGQVQFRPPLTGTRAVMSDIAFEPGDGSPAMGVGVISIPDIEMAINGSASDAKMLPVINNLLDFMHERCVGAGVLGIQRNGKVLATLGFGMRDGRSAEAIFRQGCGNNVSDPFKPQAGEMKADSPYMAGSVSKAVTYAASRWALKNALRAQDKDVRIIALTQTRLVTFQRTDAYGLMRLESWDMSATGALTQRAFTGIEQAKDFHIARVSATRFVTAQRMDDDTLFVAAYRVDPDGKITRTDTHTSGKITRLQLAAIDNQRVVLGMHLTDDSLRLRTFAVDANGQLSQPGGSYNGTGRMRDLRLISLGGSPRLVGVVRMVDPDALKFVSWDVGADGVITRKSDTTFDNAYPSLAFDIAPLGSSRFVLGYDFPTDGEPGITLQTIDVQPASGAFDEVGGSGVSNVSDFSLSALDSAQFAATMRDVNGNLRTQVFALNGSGHPIPGDADTGGGISDAALVGATGGSAFRGFVAAVRNASDKLQLISYFVQSNVVTRKDDIAGYDFDDHPWTDADVENLRLIGFQFQKGLLPQNLLMLLSGISTPPQTFGASDNPTGNAVITCSAASIGSKADPRWQAATLRDAMAHRTGQPRTSTNNGDVIVSTLLDDYRQLGNKYQYLNEENKLRAQWGDANVNNARDAIGLTDQVDIDNPDGFLIRPLEVQDALTSIGSSCLPNDPATYAYSNADPVWLAHVVQHVTGRNFVADEGNPASYAGTLLDEFMQAQVGAQTGLYKGIFKRPAAIDANGNDPFPGAKVRVWNGNPPKTSDRANDSKRPHCVWSTGNMNCSFKAWMDGTRLNWNGDVADVPFPMQGNGLGWMTGGYAFQLRAHLKFASKYWVSGYDTGSSKAALNPTIGEPRNNVWNVSNSHNGGDNGQYAYAIQYGGGCAASQGVDVVIAVNQWADALCSGGGCASDTGSNYAYSQAGGKQDLKSIVDAVICSIDWPSIKPLP